MPDREKVIKGVHDARRYLEDREWVDKSVGVHIDALNDALELMKDMCKIKMVQSIRTIAGRTLGYCPSCGRGLDSYHDGNSGEHITHFCYNCGQAVKWE